MAPHSHPCRGREIKWKVSNKSYKANNSAQISNITVMTISTKFLPGLFHLCKHNCKNYMPNGQFRKTIWCSHNANLQK